MGKPQLAWACFLRLLDKMLTVFRVARPWKYGYSRPEMATDFIGFAMADNLQKYLAKEGFPPLIVHNRTTSRANTLKQQGVIVAESVEDAVSKSDIIFSCVRWWSVFLTVACE